MAVLRLAPSMQRSSTATVYAAIRTMAPPTVAAALNVSLISATSISVSFTAFEQY